MYMHAHTRVHARVYHPRAVRCTVIDCISYCSSSLVARHRKIARAVRVSAWTRVLPSMSSYRKYLIRVSMGMDGGVSPVANGGIPLNALVAWSADISDIGRVDSQSRAPTRRAHRRRAFKRTTRAHVRVLSAV